MVYTKKTCGNPSAKYEKSDCFFTEQKKTPQFKQYKFLPERISHDLKLILASLDEVK